MIVQLVLTVLLMAVLLYAWQERRRSPAVALLALVAATTATYLVWFPTHASDLAFLAGVGRGVDLIIYLWVVISLLLLLNLHLKLRVQLELITTLAREIAIAKVAKGDGAQPPISNNPHKTTMMPAKSRADNGSPNHNAAHSGVIAKASATNG
jgi:small membrane protein